MHKRSPQKTYTAIIEQDEATGLYVGYFPGIPGAHSQGESLDELAFNLQEVLGLIFEDLKGRIPDGWGRFIGTQQIELA